MVPTFTLAASRSGWASREVKHAQLAASRGKQVLPSRPRKTRPDQLMTRGMPTSELYRVNLVIVIPALTTRRRTFPGEVATNIEEAAVDVPTKEEAPIDHNYKNNHTLDSIILLIRLGRGCNCCVRPIS